jgi:hypothetical protein
LPDLPHFADVVSVAATSDEFIDQVKSVLCDRSPERRLERFVAAAGESWEARVNLIEQHVQGALQENSRIEPIEGRANAVLKTSLPAEGLIS